MPVNAFIHLLDIIEDGHALISFGDNKYAFSCYNVKMEYSV
jgi:hypothetical protein